MIGNLRLAVAGTATGGSLKRSLGMAFSTSTIPKAFGFEDATQPGAGR